MILGLSFMLAVIRKLTGSVWLCVLCHAIVNSMTNFYHKNGFNDLAKHISLFKGF